MGATQDVQKLKDYLQKKDSRFTVKHDDEHSFRVDHPSVSEWPVAAGVIFYQDQTTAGDEEWKTRQASDECVDLVNLPGKFFPAKFSDMTWAPFYTAKAPILPNFKEFLDGVYGAKWSCAAINKCNAPDGTLFKKDPGHCDMVAYKGAKEYPLHTCGLAMQ